MCKNFQVILFSQFFETVQKDSGRRKRIIRIIQAISIVVHGVTVYTNNNKKATVTRDVKASVQGWS